MTAGSHAPSKWLLGKGFGLATSKFQALEKNLVH